MQIAKHQRRAALLRALREDDDYTPRRQRLRLKQQARKRLPLGANPEEMGGHDDDTRTDEPLPPTDPLEHYAMSTTRRLPVRLHNWLSHHNSDPAATVSTSDSRHFRIHGD